MTRRSSLSPGAAAEQQACNLLRKHGLKIQARNYRTRLGEIDIVARDGDTLVFIEVRLRSNSAFGTPSESITIGKQQRILRASQHYLQKNRIKESQACRFDAVCLITQDDSAIGNVQWIKDAFSNGNGW